MLVTGKPVATLNCEIRGVKYEECNDKDRNMKTNPDHSLRHHLADLLKGGNAHATFDEVISGIPVKLRGQKPAGLPHSPWMLLEHLRLAQWDILEFSRNKKHASPEWPEGYWPRTEAPPSTPPGTKASSVSAKI